MQRRIIPVRAVVQTRSVGLGRTVRGQAAVRGRGGDRYCLVNEWTLRQRARVLMRICWPLPRLS